MSRVCRSSDSRTPFLRPSMAGRMPIFGIGPIRRLRGAAIFIDAVSVVVAMLNSSGP